MFIQISFACLLAISCFYASVYGKIWGKFGSAIFVVASLLTIPAASLDRSWDEINYAVFTVDLLCLISLLLLAFKSDRWWPIWSASFQLIGVVTHFAKLAYPQSEPMVYEAFVSLWGIPAILVMVIGIILDNRKMTK